MLGTFVCHKIFLVPFFRTFLPIPNMFTFIQTDQRQTVEWEQSFFLMNLKYLSIALFGFNFYCQIVLFFFFALVNIFSSASSCYIIFSDSKSVLQALSVELEVYKASPVFPSPMGEVS